MRVPLWINKSLDNGCYILAVAKDFQMRVVRVRSVRGVMQGRATNGDWVALPADVLFRHSR